MSVFGQVTHLFRECVPRCCGVVTFVQGSDLYRADGDKYENLTEGKRSPCLGEALWQTRGCVTCLPHKIGAIPPLWIISRRMSPACPVFTCSEAVEDHTSPRRPRLPASANRHANLLVLQSIFILHKVHLDNHSIESINAKTLQNIFFNRFNVRACV